VAAKRSVQGEKTIVVRPYRRLLTEAKVSGGSAKVLEKTEQTAWATERKDSFSLRVVASKTGCSSFSQLKDEISVGPNPVKGASPNFIGCGKIPRFGYDYTGDSKTVLPILRSVARPPNLGIDDVRSGSFSPPTKLPRSGK